MTKAKIKEVERVRVNFDMDKLEYDNFHRLVEAGNSTVSKVLRALVREFASRSTFASSVSENPPRLVKSSDNPDQE